MVPSWLRAAARVPSIVKMPGAVSAMRGARAVEDRGHAVVFHRHLRKGAAEELVGYGGVDLRAAGVEHRRGDAIEQDAHSGKRRGEPPIHDVAGHGLGWAQISADDGEKHAGRERTGLKSGGVREGCDDGCGGRLNQ